jgi:hypothetical protein
MTRDDIIRLAEEAGFECDSFNIGIWDNREFNKFAELVAAAEREECAKAITAEINDEIEDEAYCILVALLARIRARGKQ